MNNLNLKYIIYLLLCFNISFSQTRAEIEEASNFLNFSDTLAFKKPVSFRTRSLDCFFYSIKDSVTVPNKTIIIGSHEIMIAQKIDNGYNIARFEVEAGEFENPEMVDFLETEKKQLLLKWKAQNGNNHFSDFSEGFIIIDIERMQIVADFTNYFYSSVWDEKGKEVEECYHFIPQIIKREIIFTQSHECGESKKAKFKKPIVITYQFSEDALIRKQ